MPRKTALSKHAAEVEFLRAQLAEALQSKAQLEETLRAIRQSELNARLTDQPQNPQTGAESDLIARQQAQEALWASEEKYRHLIENVNDLVCEVDAEARYLFVNAQYEQTLGYAPEELLGRLAQELIHPDDLRQSTPSFKKLVDGRTLSRNEWRFKHKNGQWRWFDCLAQTYEKSPGDVRVVVISRDITERRLYEERIAKLSRLYAMLSRVNETLVRLHETQALFLEVCRVISEAGFPLVWIGKVVERQVVPVAWCGPAADYLKSITVELEGPLGQGPTGTCIREARPVINDDFDVNPAAFPWRQTALEFGFRASAAFPLRCQGQVMGALTLYAPEPKAFDPEQVALFEALAADISYALDVDHQEKLRRQVEVQKAHALEEAQQRAAETEAVLLSLNDAVLIYNPGMNVVQANPCFIANYGFDPTGLNVRDIVERVACRWLDGRPFRLEDQPTPRAVRGEKVSGARYRIRPPGTLADRMVETASAPLRVGGQTLGSVTVWHDITEREALLSQAQESAEKLLAVNEALQQQAEELQASLEELAAAETRAENERQRLAAVMAALPTGLAITDAQGGDIRSNAAFEQIWGGSPPAAATVADYIPYQAWWVETGQPVTPHEWASAQAVEQGFTVAGQLLEIQRFDGRRAFVINSAAPVRDARGQIVGSAVSIQDITALKKAEAEIQRLASFPHANPNPVLEINRHGVVTYSNPAAAAWLERLGQPAEPSVFAPPDLDAMRHQLDQGGPAQYYRELPLGDAVLGEDIYLLPQFDAIRIYARDITQHVRSEQERRQAIAEAEEGKRILEALMRYVPEGITIAEGPDVTIRLVSQFGQDLLGGAHAQKTAEEVADQWQVYADDGFTPLPSEELPLVRAIQRGEVVHNQDLVQVNAQGRKLHLSCNAGPIRDAAGKITGAVVAWRDISERVRAEAERTRLLAEVEKRAAELEATISSMATGLIVYNAAGNAIRMNEMAEKLFRPELFFTTTVADRVRVVRWQKENGQPFAPEEIPVARALRGETTHNVVIAAPFLEQTVWIAASAAPIRTPEGQMLGAVASFIDISERKQAEQLIQDQKEQLEAQNEELTAQRDELQSQNEELAAQQEELLQYRDELEGRVRERTGELETANAVLEEEIEERRQAEERVRQNAERLGMLAEISQALVAAGPVYRATLDQIARAITVFIGDACILRLLSEDRQHLEPAAFYHADPKMCEAMRTILTAGTQSVTEGIAGRVYKTKEPAFMPHLLPDDLRRQVRPDILPVLNQVRVAGLIEVALTIQAEVLGTLGVFRLTAECPYTVEDLNLLQSLADRVALAIANARLYRDLEKALAQEQAMRQQLIQAEKLGALGRMVGSVAHELNNPLQTITNCLYLTSGALPADSVIHQYLDMASSETRRLVNLVAQLRELYRPHTAASEALPLVQLLQDVRALLASQLQKGQVQWQQSADLPSYSVSMVSDRLKQVFINVATNAIEAMQPAGGQLWVDLALAADGQQVSVSFRDTGPGIPPANLSRLFEPFFTTKSQGLGLGLAICYEIAQQHGGQITAESQPGQGAVFTVWLPLAQPPDGFTKGTSGDQHDANL